jgi:hypothetical protein
MTIVIRFRCNKLIDFKELSMAGGVATNKERLFVTPSRR